MFFFSGLLLFEQSIYISFFLDSKNLQVVLDVF